MLAESSVLSFQYLLTISVPKLSDTAKLEGFVVSALKLYKIAASQSDGVAVTIALLAIMSLALLADKNKDNSRYALQAAMFARHVLADPLYKDARPLALISTRLHLLCGLGTVAFQQYSLAKIKEMLHHTVSWVLLDRISQTHPFKVKGRFSADAELEKVIASLDKQEARTDELLHNDIQSFYYHTALELLGLKRKLNSSLAKHACNIERRRIARLTGESWVDENGVEDKGKYSIH